MPSKRIPGFWIVPDVRFEQKNRDSLRWFLSVGFYRPNTGKRFVTTPALQNLINSHPELLKIKKLGQIEASVHPEIGRSQPPTVRLWWFYPFGKNAGGSEPLKKEFVGKGAGTAVLHGVLQELETIFPKESFRKNRVYFSEGSTQYSIKLLERNEITPTVWYELPAVRKKVGQKLSAIIKNQKRMRK